MKSEFFKTRKKRILPDILISLLLPFMVFISIPFEVYASNLEEFVFSFGDFFGLQAVMFLVCSIFIFLLLYLLPEVLNAVLRALIIATGVLFFLQGNFFNSGISSLAGDALSQNEISSSRIIINAVIWAAVYIIALLFVFLRKKLSFVQMVAVILSLAVMASQVINVAVLSLTAENIFTPKNERGIKSAKDYKPYVLTEKNLENIGKEKNIFYFCVDRFDEFYADTLLKENDEFLNSLDGFTYFDDNVTVYARTFPSVAHMLTQNEYEFATDRNAFLNSAYNGDTPLSVLAENGYGVNIYGEKFYSYTDAFYIPDYVLNKESYHQSVKSPLKLMLRMSQFSAYRFAPLVLKGIVSSGLVSDTCNGYVESISDTDKLLYSPKTAAFPKSEQIKPGTDKNFSYIHLNGFHDFICNRENPLENGNTTAEIKAAAAENFAVIGEYIKALKAAGLYKDATIIITGDHPAAVNDARALDGPRTTALFVKPSGSADTPLKKSGAQLQNQIWATIFKSENIKTEKDYGKSVFEIPENENTARRYIWTYNEGTGDILNVYEIKGSSHDFKNWTLIKTQTEAEASKKK